MKRIASILALAATLAAPVSTLAVGPPYDPGAFFIGPGCAMILNPPTETATAAEISSDGFATWQTFPVVDGTIGLYEGGSAGVELTAGTYVARWVDPVGPPLHDVFDLTCEPEPDPVIEIEPGDYVEPDFGYVVPTPYPGEHWGSDDGEYETAASSTISPELPDTATATPDPGPSVAVLVALWAAIFIGAFVVALGLRR